VLTDGSVTIMSDGEHVRSMNIKDGYAMQLAVKKGYRVAIISGAKSEPARMRFQQLGITDIHLGIMDKTIVFKELLTQYKLEAASTLYMGDDMPDYHVMQLCGVPTCPSDAASDIKNIALYVSDKPGGRGCVRDVIEQVLRLNGQWQPEV
jgi:3-deoxy-D-manno-octulosonate 8-phosphate phosphatase (KDO 8-P phosphatase)